ncbi:hypothetical protein [Paenibacillus sp. S28]|uniref:hypothetical protein n=1 Tax=Paenibacillus sp. S28 TaxID=2767463 RepID=UPI00190DD183|nr:hypothetical protein [Paenibacillus sp. S28]MBJ9993125.1 hypothetical protein [Paenibacillus sp. S28]
MDNLISSLQALTENVVARLQYTAYEELQDFVQERQQLIDELNRLKQHTPFSPSQVEQLQSILQADPLILNRMDQLKMEASDWLQHRGQAKMQRSAYEAAYTPDSFLMDQRK